MVAKKKAGTFVNKEADIQKSLEAPKKQKNVSVSILSSRQLYKNRIKCFASAVGIHSNCLWREKQNLLVNLGK